MANLWTSDSGRYAKEEVVSSAQSIIIRVDLNLITLHGFEGLPERLTFSFILIHFILILIDIYFCL